MVGVPGSSVIRERLVEAGRSALFVREIGRGRPIVVVHGGPDFDHEYLLPETDRLANAFHLVYYDQRGRGRSYSGEVADDVTVDSEVGDLDRVRRTTRATTVAVLGHSWGALLALEYAIRHRERVSHLVLMNVAPVSHAGAVAFRRAVASRRSPAAVARLRELVDEPAYGRGDVDLDRAYHRIHFGATLRRREHVDAVVGRLRRSFTREGIVAARAIEARLYEQTWNRVDYDLVPALRSLPMPALVIAGDRDLCPPEIAREIAAAIPNARLAVLEDCGHFAYLEQPTAVEALIAEFMGSTGTSESV